MQGHRRNLGLSLSAGEHGGVIHRKRNTGAEATLGMSLGQREWLGDSPEREGTSINLEAKFQKTEKCHKSPFGPQASPTMQTPSWTRLGTLLGAVLHGHSSWPCMLHQYRGRGEGVTLQRAAACSSNSEHTYFLTTDEAVARKSHRPQMKNKPKENKETRLPVSCSRGAEVQGQALLSWSPGPDKILPPGPEICLCR